MKEIWRQDGEQHVLNLDDVIRRSLSPVVSNDVLVVVSDRSLASGTDAPLSPIISISFLLSITATFTATAPPPFVTLTAVIPPRAPGTTASVILSTSVLATTVLRTLVAAGAARPTAAFAFTRRRATVASLFEAPDGGRRVLRPLNTQTVALELPSMHVIVSILGIPLTPEFDESVRRGSAAVARGRNVAANKTTKALEFVGQVARPGAGMKTTDKKNTRHFFYFTLDKRFLL